MATDSTRQPTRPDPPARADRNAEHGTRTRTRSADADAQRPVRTPLTRPPTYHPLPRTPCRLCQTACANGYGSYGLDSRWYFLIFCQDERRRAVATFSTITDPRHLGAGRPRAAGKPLKKAGPVHVPRPLPGVLCFLYTCCFFTGCATRVWKTLALRVREGSARLDSLHSDYKKASTRLTMPRGRILRWYT